MNDFLLTFYGDDFTGSTDVMEALTLGGVPTILFLEPPTREFVETHFPHLRALGVAGRSRSMTPEQMNGELRPSFKALKALDAPFFHYKVCSTFDSSPEIGSIGRAIDIGLEIFESASVPMMVGAPALKRYLIFGHLFATFENVTYRLDRHPTMRQHPVTPMAESDLMLHLAKQTDYPIGLLDMLSLAQSDEAIAERYRQIVDEGKRLIFIDTADYNHLRKIGKLVWELRSDTPQFIVSSSGIEYALTAYWQESGIAEKPSALDSPNKADQLIVMSGSASPPTAKQIDWAIDNGYVPIRLDTVRLVNPTTTDEEVNATVSKALEALHKGHSVLVYSVKGPTDEALDKTRQAIESLGIDRRIVGQTLGKTMGVILRKILKKTDLRRVCVTGGDTCGYVSHQLGIYALEMIVPLAPGAPLCRAYSHDETFDGLEITLKSGHIGQANYFDSILRGTL